VGVRSIPADGLPVVGRVPGTGGLYAVATHSGFTLAILLGRLVADEIVTGRIAPELAPFRPERFARPMADAAR
jgi:glycine/D-amino acid oxidase-like deaminating enzyme